MISKHLFLAFAAASLALAAENAPEVLLWSNGAPGSEGITKAEKWEKTADGPDSRVSSVHKPSIYVFLPPKDKATGAAVVIAPGGGHRLLSIKHEGWDLARMLNNAGVAAFVLKYRLAREEGSKYTIEGHALKDTQRALRLVRSRASEWGVKLDRVGVLGFSAGGEVALLSALQPDAGDASASDPIDKLSAKPDFVALIYPGIRAQAEAIIPTGLPPFFLMSAVDDRGPAVAIGDLYAKLVKAQVPAEIHVYNSGGHGFGARQRALPISSWTVRFEEWMKDRKLLER